MSDIIVGTDGLLYKNGAKVPLEFGNEEQIKVIRAYERRLKQYSDGKIKPLFSFQTKGNIIFGCACDKTIEFITEADDDHDIKCFDNSFVQCNSCKRRYQIYTTKLRNKVAGRTHIEHCEVFVKMIR